MTSPRVRTAPPLRRSEYPAPAVDDSNQLHQVDLVGPIYLKGKRQRLYICVCKDVFDGGVYLKLAPSRKMDEVLAFLIEAWQHLPSFIPPGRPQHNSSVENYNGWFQPALFQRLFKRIADLRRELTLL